MRKHYPLNTQGAEDAGQLPWKDGVPSTGTEGSYPGQALFTDSEAEILSAIDGAGLTRNGSDLTQLIQAISRGLFLGTFGGSTSALTATIPNSLVIPAILSGMGIGGVSVAACSGPTTLALLGVNNATLNGPVLRGDGSPLQAGDYLAGQPLLFKWDGAAWRIPWLVTALLSASGVFAFIAAGSGTWIPPAGVTRIKRLRLWGAGGGGGGAASALGSAGSGGGSGAYAEAINVPCTPGVAVAWYVGQGGPSVGVGTGYDGGTTSWGGIVTAPGGKAGLTAYSAVVAAPGGVGGSAPTGGNVLASIGRNGGSGFNVPGGGALSGQGAASYGGSQSGPNLGSNGAPGYFPGGGGAGGSGDGTNSRFSGAGADGLIIGEY